MEKLTVFEILTLIVLVDQSIKSMQSVIKGIRFVSERELLEKNLENKINLIRKLEKLKSEI